MPPCKIVHIIIVHVRDGNIYNSLEDILVLVLLKKKHPILELVVKDYFYHGIMKFHLIKVLGKEKSSYSNIFSSSQFCKIPL